MPVLQFVSHVTSAAAGDVSQITDLVVSGGGPAPMLYATTRYDGAISAWQIGGGALGIVDTSAHRRSDSAGTEPDLTWIETASGRALLTGGGGSGTLSLHRINADGSLGAVDNLGTVGAFGGDLVAPVTVQLAGGAQAVYGGLAGAAGIGRLGFDAAGALTGSAVTPDSAATHADQVTALTQARVGGADYLFTVSGGEAGVTAWEIAADGALTAAGSLAAADGLWVAAPTALAAVSLNGATYLLLGAAGTGTLTVIAVAGDGTLRVTDHVIDDRTTRFDGVADLATVTHDGQVYVIAGGADDGISLFQLLPHGQLIHLSRIEDTTAMGLANVSAVAARSSGDALEIFVASASEPGITRLAYVPVDYAQSLAAAPGGSTLTGGAGADILEGRAGADRLRGDAGTDLMIDGAGEDVLTGGAGADTFVLVADDARDIISDFEQGVDRLDLSAWPMLRDISQLTLTQTATGLSIAYLGEVLILNTASGAPMAPGALQTEDILSGGAHLAPASLAGFAVDPDPPPAPPPPPGTPLPLPPEPPPAAPGDVLGGPLGDVLTAPFTGAGVYGLGGNDTLNGASGDDALYGGDGDDLLLGRNGNDLLHGGPGRDRMEGGGGDDTYLVDHASDLVIEAVDAGFDTVLSWVNYQVVPNVEVLRLQGLGDLAGVGTQAGEALVGNPGHNVLRGMGGDDVITAKAGNDRLIGGEGMDWLVGDAGADVFVYEALTDSLPGIANRDLINGFERGVDRIDLSAIDAHVGLPGDQPFDFIGGAAFGAGAVGQLRFHTWGQGNNYGILEADVNGDGRADFQIFVNLISAMSSSDFIL